MFGFFNFGIPELLILFVLGIIFLAVPIVVVVLVVWLANRDKDRPGRERPTRRSD